MSDTALLADLATTRTQLLEALGKRIVGQSEVVDAVLTAIFAGGHALLVGAPGLAKTMLVRSVADALGWDFKRIQFTPDLMPADITGTEVLYEDKQSGERRLQFVPGPVFANLVLADEINRTPPKTQAALLEAMQERAVTASGSSRPLPEPFFVLATQNPIEQEGTYPLPEAQLDRFLISIPVGYPSFEEEVAIAMLDTRSATAIEPVLAQASFHELRDLVARIPVPETTVAFAVRLARASRPDPDADAWVRDHVSWGAGPRASQSLIGAARARAALEGEAAVAPAHIRAVAPLVLAHRLVPSFRAAGEGIDGAAIVERLLEQVQP